MIRWKRSWPDLSGRMPVDDLPVSNGEYVPVRPTDEQVAAMRLASATAEGVRRKMGMSRRDFVRTSAALSIGAWALPEVLRRRNGFAGTAACDLDNPDAQLANLPGEFIFDIQTHHVDEDGLWKVTNPGFHAFFILVWPQAGCGETDRADCLGRYHYIKEVYLDSSTTMGVLSAVPSSPDRNPLPTIEAAETVQLVNSMSGTERTVMHQFVMPNRGSYGGTLYPGLYMDAELQAMSDAVARYPFLRAWKCYTPWGDIPNASGWFHDDRFGRRMIEHAIAIGVPVIATHKGFALPSFDQRSAAARDIGVVARDYADQGFQIIVYHSGFNSEAQNAYAGDGVADSTVAAVDGFIKSLRENGWSARHFAPGGTPAVAGAAGDGNPAVHANVPNVYAEIGSTWRDVMNRASTAPDGTRQTGIQAAHLLGKLITYVGARRVVWGTDSLWYGSPQREIMRLREYPRPDETEARRILAEVYNLPHHLDGDVDDPTQLATDPARTIRNGIFGRNAAVPYEVDPDTARAAIECSELQAWRDQQYVQNAGTARETRPLASNVVYGPRTRREVLANTWPNKPWAP